MTRRVVVEADGGSRGNPGPAGYGAVIRDLDTGEEREAAAGIGIASNNVAEYRGLIAGLELARDWSADDVEVRMDSKLVVEQMSGRWKVKHPDMQQLARQAAALVRDLPSVRFTHMPREQNQHADRLANQAMDAQATGTQWTSAAAPGPTEKPRNVLYGWTQATGERTIAMLLRHGETAMSVEKRFSGRSDVPLSPRGVEQAKAAAKRVAELGPDVIVSSPLPRCQQTAQAVADVLGLEVLTDNGFAETDFGQWDGLTVAEVKEQWPGELEAWLASKTVAPPDGESVADTARRVQAARDRVIAEHTGASVVVVSHVTPIKLLLRDALDASDQALFRIHLEPASLSIVDWRETGASVVRLLNETSYLGEHATPSVTS